MSCSIKVTKKVVVKASPPRGFSAYEIARQLGYEGSVEDWNASVNEARSSAEQAAEQAAKSKDAATEQRQYAESARLEAEHSAEIALSANRIFATQQEGQSSSNLQAGDYFWVVSASSDLVATLWRKGSTSAEPTNKQITTYAYAKRNRTFSLAGLVL